jgi:hypothetical protein
MTLSSRASQGRESYGTAAPALHKAIYWTADAVSRAGRRAALEGAAKAKPPTPVFLSEPAGANATKGRVEGSREYLSLKCRFRKF